MKLRELVLEKRNELKLSRVRFAQIVGVSEAVIGDIENRRREALPITVAKLSLILEKDLSTLIHWKYDMSEERKRFPLMILTAQAKKGITNSELAEAIGVNRMTISFYQSGKTQPSSGEIIKKLAQTLDIEYADLQSAWCWKKLDFSTRYTDTGEIYCSRCHRPRPKTEFHRYGDGYFATCKTCRENTRQAKLQKQAPS